MNGEGQQENVSIKWKFMFFTLKGHTNLEVFDLFWGKGLCFMFLFLLIASFFLEKQADGMLDWGKLKDCVFLHLFLYGFVLNDET